MEIGDIKVKKLRFPGRAGEHQAAGETGALVRELGDNYDTYHQFLKQQWNPRMPRPQDYERAEDYFDAWTTVHELAAAEALIRVCRAHRKLGHALGESLDTKVPLIDRDDNLVHVEQAAT
jgi:hypothetical protein